MELSTVQILKPDRVSDSKEPGIASIRPQPPVDKAVIMQKKKAKKVAEQFHGLLASPLEILHWIDGRLRITFRVDVMNPLPVGQLSGRRNGKIGGVYFVF
jgi:hypothetical protein